ncbi:MAG TPA: T9SS type A sorting domain-containing protein [Bacteroidia bacterium]
MKKYVFIFGFVFIGLAANSQSYINYVIGRYSVIISYSGPNNNCPGILDLVPNTYYSNCVFQRDSCFVDNAHGFQPWDILVQSDTTFIGYEPWTVAAAASGKLYANDSIYLNVKDFGTNNPNIEYWGFKLYSTVGIEELSKRGNELLISPQPANEIIYIQSTQMRFTGKPVLYDINGKQVGTEMQYVNAHTYKADVSQLQPGIYFVFVLSDTGYVKKKILVGS